MRLFQRARFVGQSGDKIQRNVIQLGQANRQAKGDFALTLLLVGIGGFGHMKNLYQLILSQIMILPQIAQALILHSAPPFFTLTKYHKCGILILKIQHTLYLA